MINKTTSHNACYAHSDLPVPLGFNTPKNHIDIRIHAYSDVSVIDISLYEYHGLYWYSFTVDQGKIMNSLGFVGLRNCVSSLRGVVRGLGFTLDNSECLTRFVRTWDSSNRKAF